MLFFNCKNTTSRNTLLNTNATDTIKMPQDQQKIDSVIYEATTRGYYEKIMITANKVSYTHDRNTIAAEFQDLDTEAWLNLINSIETVGLANIEQFEAPTKMHQVDGAALAHIEIHSEERMYRTQTFDKGNPPKELSSIYNTIQTIIENMDKQ